ncbi:hypothetical protein FORC085_914 [Bacillus cereus]|nr:hypothetical protein FORC085_914 [Bacillus cereus]
MDFKKQRQPTVLGTLEEFNVDVVIENAKKKKLQKIF